MSIDLVSILQNGKRTFSFMTSCLGLMANLDLGTEYLRFMGSQYALPLFVPPRHLPCLRPDDSLWVSYARVCKPTSSERII